MAEAGDKSITLSRVIDAPVDEVFAAWTDPALLEQWQAERVDFEAFEGGKFAFETTDEDDPSVVHTVTGTVIGFEEERKLAELWQIHTDEGVTESTLVVAFAPLDADRTQITLTEIADAHEDPQSRIFSIEAWNAAIAELAELLE